MVVALTTNQKLGIGLVAAAFIVFALVSAFVLPQRDHNFPGPRGMPLFIASTTLLFIAMLAAIVVFARESEEEEDEPAAAVAEGYATAGKDVFASKACGSCHTLAAAGASGTIGPDLDQLKPGHDAVVEQVTNGGGGMPAFGDQLSEQQIQDVAAFVVESTS
ncbi:MAG: cytochrome c [Gaiellaceae bacterium]